MTARRNSRTYRPAAPLHPRVLAARRELLAEEEPIHRYPHPIPQPRSAAVSPAAASEPTSQAMTQVLEQLSCQSQLLVDLLGAVNALTATLLCQTEKL